MRKISILALAAISFISIPTACEKEVDLNNVPTEEHVSTATRKSFICTFGDPDSKVSIANDGKTKWEIGDQILVHGEYIGTKNSKKYSTVVELTSADIIDNGKKAIITFDVDPNGVDGIVPYVKDGYSSTFYAAYPASAHIQTNEKHVYHYCEFIGSNAPLMAAYNEGDTFVFKAVTAAVSFVLPNTFDFDHVLFMGNNKEVIGYSGYSMKYGHATGGWEEIEIPNDRSSGEQTSITVPVVCDGTTRNIIYLARKLGEDNIHFSAGFTLKFIKGGEVVKYASNKNDLTINIGDYLNLGTLDAPIVKTYTSPVHTPASWTSTAEDLSSKPANSYIVYHKDVAGYSANAGKAFKIKAVQGNSSTSVGVAESAEVFWESYSINETPTAGHVVADVDFDANYVYFKMPDASNMHTGNAVIALRNSANVVLWSWHIWVPGSVVTSSDYGDLAGATLMDRNLGALVAATSDAQAPIESFGLLYQWGRKDPITGAKKYDEYPSMTPVTKNAFAKNEGQYTLAQSIQNPNVYAYVYGESTIDWLSTSDATLWNKEGNLKSQYDPCPYGYRVPLRNGDKPFWTKSDENWEFNKDNTNYWCTYSTSGAIFPYPGYIDCWGGSLSMTTKRTVVWAADQYNDAQGYCMEVRADRSSTLYYNYHNGKAKAGSVRCAVYAAEP